jgi:hypothetical protein
VGDFQSSLVQIIHGQREFKFSNKGSGHLQRGDNNKKCQNRVGSFQNLLKNYMPRKAEIYMKAFWHSTISSLLKSWPLVSGGAAIGKTVFTNFYKRNIF